MNYIIRTILIVCITSTAYYSNAQDFTATGGEWTTAGSWSPAGPPTNGSTVLIPAGVTITITNQTVNFNGTLEVYGTLSLLTTGGFFSPAAILNMDVTSSVNVYSGGSVTSGGGGFWEALSSIVIDNNIFPPAFNDAIDGGALPGPITLDPSGQTPLPVELLFFKANGFENKVELTWATAMEKNFDYFSLERSSDGKNFKEITRLNGTGNSVSRVDYEYLDEFPLSNVSYYRLTSIDFDGYTEVFDYAVVNLGDLATDFEVFPNPIDNNILSVRTNFQPEKPLDLIVVNNLGRIEAEYQVDDWLNTFEANNLHPGSYILKLVTPSGVIVKRILVK